MMNDSDAANLWRTRDGLTLRISEMETQYIANVIAFLVRKGYGWHPVRITMQGILNVRGGEDV